MHRSTDAVSKRVLILRQPRLVEALPGHGIDLEAAHARPNRRKGTLDRRAHNVERAGDIFGWRPCSVDEPHTLLVGAVSGPPDAEVDVHQMSRLDPDIGGSSMPRGRLRPGV